MFERDFKDISSYIDAKVLAYSLLYRLGLHLPLDGDNSSIILLSTLENMIDVTLAV